MVIQKQATLLMAIKNPDSLVETIYSHGGQQLLPMVIKVSEELLEAFPDRVDPLIERWISGRSQYGSV